MMMKHNYQGFFTKNRLPIFVGQPYFALFINSQGHIQGLSDSPYLLCHLHDPLIASNLATLLIIIISSTTRQFTIEHGMSSPFPRNFNPSTSSSSQ